MLAVCRIIFDKLPSAVGIETVPSHSSNNMLQYYRRCLNITVGEYKKKVANATLSEKKIAIKFLCSFSEYNSRSVLHKSLCVRMSKLIKSEMTSVETEDRALELPSTLSDLGIFLRIPHSMMKATPNKDICRTVYLSELNDWLIRTLQTSMERNMDSASVDAGDMWRLWTSTEQAPHKLGTRFHLLDRITAECLVIREDESACSTALFPLRHAVEGVQNIEILMRDCFFNEHNTSFGKLFEHCCLYGLLLRHEGLGEIPEQSPSFSQGDIKKVPHLRLDTYLHNMFGDLIMGTELFLDETEVPVYNSATTTDRVRNAETQKQLREMKKARQLNVFVRYRSCRSSNSSNLSKQSKGTHHLRDAVQEVNFPSAFPSEGTRKQRHEAEKREYAKAELCLAAFGDPTTAVFFPPCTYHGGSDFTFVFDNVNEYSGESDGSVTLVSLEVKAGDMYCGPGAATQKAGKTLISMRRFLEKRQLKVCRDDATRARISHIAIVYLVEGAKCCSEDRGMTLRDIFNADEPVSFRKLKSTLSTECELLSKEHGVSVSFQAVRGSSAVAWTITPLYENLFAAVSNTIGIKWSERMCQE